MRSEWLALGLVCAGCGKVEKLQADAQPNDAALDATPDAPADAAPDAAPVDPLVNGSFEMNYTGWTLNEDSGMPTVGYWGISGTTTFAAGTTVHDYNDNIDGVPSCFNVGTNMVVVADGVNAAFNTQSGPERHRIWQDVTLPPEAKLLTWSMGYANGSTTFDLANQSVAIEVADPATGTVLSNLFVTDPATTPPQALAMTALSAPIAGYAGQNVRITVDLQARSNCMFLVVDDFRITF